MGHQFLEIRIQKIYLDNNNPRHDPIDNEPSGERQLSWPVDDNYLGRFFT